MNSPLKKIVFATALVTTQLFVATNFAACKSEDDTAYKAKIEASRHMVRSLVKYAATQDLEAPHARSSRRTPSAYNDLVAYGYVEGKSGKLTSQGQKIVAGHRKEARNRQLEERNKRRDLLAKQKITAAAIEFLSLKLELMSCQTAPKKLQDKLSQSRHKLEALEGLAGNDNLTPKACAALQAVATYEKVGSPVIRPLNPEEKA